MLMKFKKWLVSGKAMKAEGNGSNDSVIICRNKGELLLKKNLI